MRGASLEFLIEIARDATGSFEEARRLRPDAEHGYVSEIQMLIFLIDQGGKGGSNTVGGVLGRGETDSFLRRGLERAEDLLDRACHLHVGESTSGYVVDCRARLQRFYGDYATALQAWDSLLSRHDVVKPPVRRQIVWTILRRRSGVWEDITNTETDRIQGLLEDNLDENSNDATSIRLWLRAVRQARNPPSLDAVIERVSYWKANTSALDAAYYLYVLHTLRALEGSAQGAADAERALDQCRAIARFRRDRRLSFEWIGRDSGIGRLVHQSRLGKWAGEFWGSVEALARLRGRVGSIDGPEKGRVELRGGVEAFFVPAKAGFHSSRDENVAVSCYLGFSYDGPRAWDVRRLEV